MSKEIPASNPLAKVHDLLNEGHTSAAMHIINGSGQHSGAMENARGVCLLRMGKAEEARIVFGSLTFPNKSIGISPETPTVYQTNYVTANILADHTDTGLHILSQIQDDQHPAVKKLRSAVAAWKKSLGLHHRLMLLLGVYPNKPIALDFVPGDF
jgi:hypothetical protein